ncbi:MAG: class I SAM-dependent methyltransferase [Bacteroidota bacterium]
MYNPEDAYFKLIGKEKNIYELATLFPQNRRDVGEYVQLLKDPKSEEEVLVKGNKIISSTKEYPITDNVADFSDTSNNSDEWKKLNKQFLNYHKSLNVYEMINSMPIINYLSLKTGLGFVKNIKVLDVGGGTGHAFSSFFQYPETIEYFLLDPNLRLLHDQFIRMFPKLSYLKMAHILANAEALPIKNNSFDMVLSLAAIDHLNDYKKFIAEAYRVLIKGGTFFVSSHLDQPESLEDKTKLKSKLFSYSFWERVARYLYYRKYKVGSDDHTLHLKDEIPIEQELIKTGFIIEKKEVFKRNFYFVGVKQ